jgi:hypothetical protein
MQYKDSNVTESTGRLTRPDGSMVYAYALTVTQDGVVTRALGVTCESEGLFRKAVAWVRETIGVDELR